jgi:hypothetical protein
MSRKEQKEVGNNYLECWKVTFFPPLLGWQLDFLPIKTTM